MGGRFFPCRTAPCTRFDMILSMMKKRYFCFTCLLALALCTGCGSKAEPASSEPASSAAVSSEPAEPTPAPGPAFAIEVPEGFSEAEMPGTLAYYTNEDGAVISLTTSAKDPDFSTPDTDALIAALRSQYAEQLREENLQIEVVNSTNDPICGFPSYQLELSCSGQGYSFTQLFVGIDADMTYSWVFTGSEEHAEQFRQCVQSITNTVDL